jgi:tricarballylate dehydrogenase
MQEGGRSYDAVVVGMGIAGLAAAVSAMQSGARVAILERAPKEERGGNTRWTEAFMRMKNESEVSDDFEDHFMQNSGFHLDPQLTSATAQPYAAWPGIVKALSFSDLELVGTLAAGAGPTLAWLKSFGIRFSDMASYLITQSTTRICPVGGGLALVEALAAYAEAKGADIFYQTTARALLRDETGAITGLRASDAAGRWQEFHGAVVLACGGFEGNAEMQARYYGERSRYIRPVARGGYYNKGEGIQMALAAGAAPCGDFTEYHAEPIDPRSGESEPIIFNFPYGILVDNTGERFVDEASAAVDAIYENIARMISRLPGGIAYAICDTKLDQVPNWQRTVRTDQPPIVADSIAGLAAKLDIPADRLEATLATFNAATRPGEFHPLEVDGLSTEGLSPPKSNWALPIDTAPFRAWPITSANCFTFGGVKCNASAQVIDTDGIPIRGLYAAGETAGLYYGRYTGATSVLRGAVFGRIAGRHLAAALAQPMPA